MRRARTTRLGAAFLSCVLLAGAAWPEELRRPGVRPDPSSIEAGLWDLSAKAETDAQRSAELNQDEALTAYVRSVACKVAREYCNEVRVYVMDRPFFNAQMAPNGYMEVWSGALLRVGSESELAFILGHETGHFALNHSYETHRAMKARANTALIASLAVSVAGAAAAASASSVSSAQSISSYTQGLVNVVYLGAVASLFGFSRENESDADVYGFNAAVQAGYNPAAGALIWRRLIEETSHSDFDKVRKSQTRASIFDTHPLAQDRLAVLDQLAAQRASAKLVAQPRGEMRAPPARPRPPASTPPPARPFRCRRHGPIFPPSPAARCRKLKS